MAERQSRTISQADVVARLGGGWIIQPKAVILSIWLLLLALGFQHAHANDDAKTHLAMGDVGVIKTEVSDPNASMVKWAQLTPEQKKFWITDCP